MENLICYPNVYVITEKTGEKTTSVPCQKISRGKYIIPGTFDSDTNKLLFCRKGHPHVLVNTKEEESIKVDPCSNVLILQPANFLDDPIAVMAGGCDGEAVDSSFLEEICDKVGIAYTSRKRLTGYINKNTRFIQKLCWIWIGSKDVERLSEEVAKKSHWYRLSSIEEDNPYYN